MTDANTARRRLERQHSILERSAATMLAELLSHERALLEFVLAQLDTRSLAMCARAAQWLHAHALETAEQRVARLIETEPRVARWRRTSAVGSRAVLREAHHIEAGVQYVVRISGRYRLDTNVVLDIAPTGDYVNYSTASLEAPGHCFRGVATVAGVLPSPDASVDFLYLFDRGYSTCIFDGVQIPAARLPFVRENYQCFSVSCHHLPLQPPSPTVAGQLPAGGRRARRPAVPGALRERAQP